MPFNWRTKFKLFFLKTCPLTGELSSDYFFFFSFQECGKLNHLDLFHMSPNSTSNWPMNFFLLLLLPTTGFQTTLNVVIIIWRPISDIQRLSSAHIHIRRVRLNLVLINISLHAYIYCIYIYTVYIYIRAGLRSFNRLIYLLFLWVPAGSVLYSIHW